MTVTNRPSTVRTGPMEFIFLMAAMAALDAFSIDAMLPALGQMSSDLNIMEENHRQRVITFIFLGFSIGVLVYGFIADSYGRRTPTIAGFLIFCVGTILCITATQFDVLLLGRVLQGLGAAGPYVLSIAIVRDLYQGRQMARKLSLIAMVFIGVPMVAPFVGQGILFFASWRIIFLVLLIFAVLILLWFWSRQVETLKTENRHTLSGTAIWSSIVTVFTTKQTVSYILAIGVSTGAFIVYLSTGQQVFQEMYGLGNWFPIVFASLASCFGIASYFNARWVETYGTARMVHLALSAIVISSVILLIGLKGDTLPDLWIYLLYLAVILSAFAFLFGNLTTLALEPMAHIAGAASSLVSSLSTLLAIGLASLIGAQLTTGVVPVVAGFGILCSVAWIINFIQARAIDDE